MTIPKSYEALAADLASEKIISKTLQGQKEAYMMLADKRKVDLDAALAREAALREELDAALDEVERHKKCRYRVKDQRNEFRIERDALQQRLTVAEQDSLELRSALVGSLAREDELSARLSELDDEWSRSITEIGFLSLERDRLKSFAEQIARQQGEPYFAKLAKAALKPDAEGEGS